MSSFMHRYRVLPIFCSIFDPLKTLFKKKSLHNLVTFGADITDYPAFDTAL